MILQTGSEEVIGLLPKRHVQQIGLCEKNRKRAIIMAYKVIILYRLYMPSYFLGTFTEYPRLSFIGKKPFSDKIRSVSSHSCALRSGRVYFSGRGRQ